MRSKGLVTGFALATILACGWQTAEAGAKIKINDESSIDLGFRLQVQSIFTNRDFDGDGEYDPYTEWKVRRARFRLKGVVNSQVSMFFQTDVSKAAMQMIDAYIHYKPMAMLQFIVGENLVPANRQNVTSSGALMAMDFTGSSYKSMNWGMRSLHTFTTSTYKDSDSTLRTEYNVRDLGCTVFGTRDLSDDLHMKYYLGMYNGLPVGGTKDDESRMTARVQFNLGDAEGGYYNSGSYLGKKQTIGVGVSYDMQGKVATAGMEDVDYGYMSADVFAEQPLGDGSLSAELGYSTLDLGGLMDQIEGSGLYLQAGYLLPNKQWQPWFLYENWIAEVDMGSSTTLRLGLTYFIKGHNANIKIGFENFTADAPIDGTNEDAISTIMIGFYTTY